ncbi:hypothetical protein QGM71_20325 [Virgibacillus sp. C22-A2]|uniref:YolD-like family protein n=1 Tax=Virgibacillus tibetensis TaxID=3042313 RepID=A0ABU6KKH3_9BACI|nr:hypothetical protein [Virgibacillus sp. C22-A2]
MSVNNTGITRVKEKVKVLRHLWKDKDVRDQSHHKVPDINSRLLLAIHNELTVEIKHYNGRDFLTSKGKLAKVDQRDIRLNNNKEIKMDNILSVYIE